MISTLQLYIDVTLAIAIMMILGFASRVVALALTGDLKFALLSADAVFILTGAGLIVCLWRITQAAQPLNPSI